MLPPRPRPLLRPLFGLIALVFFAARAGSVFGQTPDTVRVVLPEIEIEAARASETESTAPYAVSVLARGPERVALEADLSAAAVLRELPGLWINDRGHFALGERLSVRGMGSRAAFGVRGVQVILDGIPLTMPDGQAVLDVVDPVFIRRAELVRGPASRFWGNGGGGALFLSTAFFADRPALRARVLGGSYGTRQAAFEASVPAGRHRFHVHASDFRRDGYREHSGGGFTRAGLHGDLALDARTRLRLTAALAAQDVEHPGSLTRAQYETDPRGANPRFAETRAGKESLQAQAGATLLRETGPGLLTVTAYGLSRTLDNPLPFAYIDLDRKAGGLRLMLRAARRRLRWGFGLDAGFQGDDRRNFNNDAGRAGSDRRLDQRETVRDLAAFGFVSLPLAAPLRLTLSLRADHVRFAMTDRLLANGDQSGSRTFAALSPAAGLAYRLGDLLFFANVSTAFETPTTTELVNRPDLTGGFNPELDPQKVRGFEAGARGALPGIPVRIDVAVFRLDVTDRLVPFQAEDDGRTYFRNSGANTHEGVEVSATWTPRPWLTLRTVYAGSRFVFDDEALAGNRLPGIPARRFFGDVRIHRRGWWTRLVLESVSAYFANDANTEKNDEYTVVDVYAGHEGWSVGRVRLQPFARAGNLFDARYSGSVSINAFGGRFYEPAPGRTFEAGLNVTL